MASKDEESLGEGGNNPRKSSKSPRRSSKKSTPKTIAQIREEVTTRLLADIDKGELPPWRKGFERATSFYDGPRNPHNFHSKHEYNGINFLLTLGAKLVNEYPTNAWGTFNNIKEAGGSVIKNEKGLPILFRGVRLIDAETNKPIKIEDKDSLMALKDRNVKKIPYIREYYVWNVAQTTGLEHKFKMDIPRINDALSNPDHMMKRDLEVIEVLKGHLTSLGISYRENPSIASAYYSISKDTIVMPQAVQFESISAYTSTLAHEMIHSTMKVTGRSDIYLADMKAGLPKEELTAEIGASMLMAKLGMPFNCSNAASYIDAWEQKSAMQSDHKLIFDAARDAEFALAAILTPEIQEKIRLIDERYDLLVSANDAVEVTATSGSESDVSSESENLSIQKERQASESVVPAINFEDAFSEALAMMGGDAESDDDTFDFDSAIQTLIDANLLVVDDKGGATIDAPETSNTGSDEQFDPAVYVTCFADSVEQLREIDVFNMLDRAHSIDVAGGVKGSMLAADFICQHRPDLIDEVTSVMRDELSVVRYAYSSTKTEVVEDYQISDEDDILAPSAASSNKSKSSDLSEWFNL